MRSNSGYTPGPNHTGKTIFRWKTKRNGEDAYDVLKIGTALGDGKYELRGFDDSGCDYFDGSTDTGMWSIGQRLSDGKIIASLRSDMYLNPDYECLWLR